MVAYSNRQGSSDRQQPTYVENTRVSRLGEGKARVWLVKEKHKTNDGENEFGLYEI